MTISDAPSKAEEETKHGEDATGQAAALTSSGRLDHFVQESACPRFRTTGCVRPQFRDKQDSKVACRCNPVPGIESPTPRLWRAHVSSYGIMDEYGLIAKLSSP